VAKALSLLHIVRRIHVAVWKWIQKYWPRRISSRRKRVAKFIVDETVIKAGSEYIWLWVAIGLVGGGFIGEFSGYIFTRLEKKWKNDRKN
jgi:transposase-like protein